MVAGLCCKKCSVCSFPRLIRPRQWWLKLIRWAMSMALRCHLCARHRRQQARKTLLPQMTKSPNPILWAGCIALRRLMCLCLCRGMVRLRALIRVQMAHCRRVAILQTPPRATLMPKQQRLMPRSRWLLKLRRRWSCLPCARPGCGCNQQTVLFCLKRTLMQASGMSCRNLKNRPCCVREIPALSTLR